MVLHWKGIVAFVGVGGIAFIVSLMKNAYLLALGSLVVTAILLTVYMMGESDFLNDPNQHPPTRPRLWHRGLLGNRTARR